MLVFRIPSLETVCAPQKKGFCPSAGVQPATPGRVFHRLLVLLCCGDETHLFLLPIPVKDGGIALLDLVGFGDPVGLPRETHAHHFGNTFSDLEKIDSIC